VLATYLLSQEDPSANVARRPANILQFRSASGERLWTWITWAFAAYWVLFVAGALLGQKQLNFVGAVVILAVLGWAALDRLWVRLDAVVVASLALACLPAIQLTMGTHAPLSADYLIKHVSLCLVMALSRLLRLPVISTLKVRWVLAAQILVILFISLILHRGDQWDGGRVSGLFVNPNNLALIPFLLLFFVDRFRDRRLIQLAAHALVILVLAFTATSGAVVAYAIGLAMYLSSSVSRSWRILISSAAVLALLAVSVCVAAGNEGLFPETRLTKQIFLMRSQFQTVLQGESFSYYEKERELGSGTGSAIWRVEHWRDTLQVYSESTATEQLFGLGPGSSVALIGKLPHNEYLRLLFEEGIVGFALFFFAWYRIVRTAPAGIRYIALIFALYSFSENNLDNFPFMALFTLCLSASVMAQTTPLRSWLKNS
jgi:hypothetical protein